MSDRTVLLSPEANRQIQRAREIHRARNPTFPRLSKDKYLKLVPWGNNQIIVTDNDPDPNHQMSAEYVSDVVNEDMYDSYMFPSLKRNGELTFRGWIFPLSEYHNVVEFLRGFDFFDRRNLIDRESDDESLFGSETDDEDYAEDMWAQMRVARVNKEVNDKIYGGAIPMLKRDKNGNWKPERSVATKKKAKKVVPKKATKKVASTKKKAKKAKKPAAKKTATKKPAAKKTAVAAKKKQAATKKAKKETKPKKTAAKKKVKK